MDAIAPRYFRPIIWFIASAACLISLVGAPIVGSMVPYNLGWNRQPDPFVQTTLQELDRLGLLKNAPKGSVSALIEYRRETGKSLGQVLRDPAWVARLGLQSEPYKATWYITNPFDVLPTSLQKAIQKRRVPFRSRMNVWQWCRRNQVPKIWRRALYAALIETTPINLWRASRGRPSLAKNGQPIQPIVVDYGQGRMDVLDGHIATDPRFIPTNSHVLVLLKIKGKDRVLRVKASDIGGAIKGKHVDLPIQVHPGSTQPLPYTLLPKNYIRNRTVQILTPLNPVNPDQKA